MIRSSGAERVLVTHGLVEPMVRWLTERGLQSAPLHTEFRGDLDEGSDPVAADGGGAHETIRVVVPLLG